MEYKSLGFKAENIEGRSFMGYASTWDLDQGDDIIQMGAFKKTLAEAGARVKILWQHDQYAPIGIPVLMREDSKGLYVEGKISETRQGDEALTLLKDGVIDSMSIGYRVINADYDSKGVRIIKELALKEFSLVTFPMNEAAIVTGVKSIRDRIASGAKVTDKELKQLSEMVADLSALLKKEPSNDTQEMKQPQNLSEFKRLADVMGQLAQTFKN